MFSEKVKALRQKSGMSQQTLANLCGVTQGSVSHWEKGRAFPETQVAQKLCSIFNVPLSELLDEEDSRGHIQESFVVDTSGSMSARSSSNIPTGEEAKQGMIAALEKEMAKYLVSQVDKRIAEATQILTAMTDEEYQMALNILRAMKK